MNIYIKYMTIRNLLLFFIMALSISNLIIPNIDSLQNFVLRAQISQAYENAKKMEVLQTLRVDKTLISTDNELKMNFCYMPGLAKKQKQGQNRNIAKKSSEDPFINIEQGLFVRNFGQTHILMFNKYNVFEKHMIVVTRKFEAQTALITLDDMIYTGLTTRALNGVLYFNGGKISGSSQFHKHLQVLPEESRKLPIISEILEYVETLKLSKKVDQSQILKYPHFDFIHGMVALEPSSSSFGQRLFSAYKTLYSHIIEQNSRFDGADIGYNIVGCDTFLMMIPRKQQKAFGVSVNGIGFMGSILFKDEDVMGSFLQQYGPTEILEEISFK